VNQTKIEILYFASKGKGKEKESYSSIFQPNTIYQSEPPSLTHLEYLVIIHES